MGLRGTQDGPSATEADAADAGVPPETPEAAVGVEDGTLAAMAGRPVPKTPESWQRRKCRPEGGEVELFGACYQELARRPPCLVGQYEWQGRCYVAMGQRPKSNTSVQE